MYLFPERKLAESTSAVSDASTDNTTSLPDAHAPGPGIVSTSMQTVQLSAQFQSHSSSTLPYCSSLVSSLLLLDLLDQDSEMQRAMGAADSFDGASTNQGQFRGSIMSQCIIFTYGSQHQDPYRLLLK
jgi:hypothetical protein